MSDEIRWRQCRRIVTGEANSAFQEIRYAGYNPMCVQCVQEQTDRQRTRFLASYVCKLCQSKRG